MVHFLPVCKRTDISRRGLSWAVSRAELSPELKRKGAFCPPIKSSCLAVCRGCLPPCQLFAYQKLTAAPTLLRSRFHLPSRRSLSSPPWSRRAGCDLSSPSPERTADGRPSLSPRRGSPLLGLLFVWSPVCSAPIMGKVESDGRTVYQALHSFLAHRSSVFTKHICLSYTLTLTLLPTGAAWLRALVPFGHCNELRALIYWSYYFRSVRQRATNELCVCVHGALSGNYNHHLHSDSSMSRADCLK